MKRISARLLSALAMMLGIVAVGFTTAAARPAAAARGLAVRGPAITINKNSARRDCNITCAECTVNGRIGAYRYSAPMTNENGVPNAFCDIYDACTYNCGELAFQFADSLQSAIERDDVSAIDDLIDGVGTHIVADPSREVFDVVGCDGQTVYATQQVGELFMTRFLDRHRNLH